MSKKAKTNINAVAALIALCAVILVASASLILDYYTPMINSRDNEIANQTSQIASLNATISSLNGQIASLKSQITSLQEKYTANLVTALGAREILGSNSSVLNHLFITGTVTNTGVTTAYNAGLHIDGYASNGTVLISITVPITYYVSQDGFTNATALSTIYPTQSLTAEISIFHNGNLASWTITPVWTNLP
jgi:hypothetical protein